VNSSTRRAFVFAVLATLAVWYVPGVRMLGLPLVWLSTAAHEGGHALAAALVGGTVHELQLFANGSGVARSSYEAGRLAQATVAAGGLVGPSVMAWILFRAGRSAKGSRMALYAGSLICLVVTLWIGEGAFTWDFLLGLGGLLFLLARKGGEALQHAVVLFLGIQLSLSVFSRGDYLFMAEANMGGGVTMPSDVSHISRALFLPYWFWGALLTLVNLGILWSGWRGLMQRSGGRAPA